MASPRAMVDREEYGTMSIGKIEGVKIGAVFESRAALRVAGIHMPLEAGIAGRAATGAESIVLSGGYPDDEDQGDEIIYTGHGGRDRSSGRQVADQEFTRQNQALITSCLQGLPIRVVRGSGLRSPYSPKTGYSYAGLYWVDSYWKERGAAGFLVCRYRLVASASYRGNLSGQQSEGTGKPTRRVETTILH